MAYLPLGQQKRYNFRMSTNAKVVESDFPFIGKVAKRVLVAAGYTHLSQLTRVTERELLAMHGVGPKAIRILKEALKEKGLSFAE